MFMSFYVDNILIACKSTDQIIKLKRGFRTWNERPRRWKVNLRHRKIKSDHCSKNLRYLRIVILRRYQPSLDRKKLCM